jgi:hypothetical protein
VRPIRQKFALLIPKKEFRRSAICSVSAIIGIDWSILEVFSENGVTGLAQKRPSAMTNGASGHGVAVRVDCEAARLNGVAS